MSRPPDCLLVENLHLLHRVEERRQTICAEGLAFPDRRREDNLPHRIKRLHPDDFSVPDYPGVIEILPEQTDERKDKPVPQRWLRVLRQASDEDVSLDR